jgi:hypothetical protein
MNESESVSLPPKKNFKDYNLRQMKESESLSVPLDTYIMSIKIQTTFSKDKLRRSQRVPLQKHRRLILKKAVNLNIYKLLYPWRTFVVN